MNIIYGLESITFYYAFHGTLRIIYEEMVKIKTILIKVCPTSFMKWQPRNLSQLRGGALSIPEHCLLLLFLPLPVLMHPLLGFVIHYFEKDFIIFVLLGVFYLERVKVCTSMKLLIQSN